MSFSCFSTIEPTVGISGSMICSSDNWFNPLGYGAEIRIPLGSGQINGIGSDEMHHHYLLKCGIDLICGPNFNVFAVESGTIVSIETFFDNKKKPWISSSKALLVSGQSGVVCYGNIKPNVDLKIGSRIYRGDIIGKTVPYFSKPSKAKYGETRLRIELYKHNTKKQPKWFYNAPVPKNVLNPTPFLLPLIVTTVHRRRIVPKQ